MTKEEISAKSRKDNKSEDKTEKKIFSDAMKFSYAAMLVSAAIFAIVRSVKGYPTMDLPAVCCISVFADFMYRYVKTKEKFNFVIAVVMFINAVVFAVLFFMGR